MLLLSGLYMYIGNTKGEMYSGENGGLRMNLKQHRKRLKKLEKSKKIGWSKTTNPSIPRTKALVTRNIFERIWGAELKFWATLTNPPLCRFCPRRCKRNRRKWKTQSGHQTKIQPGWKTNCCSATNFWPVLEKKGIKTVDAISQCVWCIQQKHREQTRWKMVTHNAGVLCADVIIVLRPIPC